MATFRVDLGHLDQTTSQLASLVQFVEARLAELDRAVRAMPTWTGEAASAFDTAHRQWNSAARDLHRGMATMQLAAARAHQSYVSATSVNLANLGRD